MILFSLYVTFSPQPKENRMSRTIAVLTEPKPLGVSESEEKEKKLQLNLEQGLHHGPSSAKIKRNSYKVFINLLRIKRCLPLKAFITFEG